MRESAKRGERGGGGRKSLLGWLEKSSQRKEEKRKGKVNEAG